MSNPKQQLVVGVGALTAAIGAYMYAERWEVVSS